MTEKTPEQNIQTVDIRDFRDPAKKADFIKAVSKSFREIGFLIVEGHDLDADFQRNAYEKIDQFYKLPYETKMKYELPNSGGARGFTVFGKEHAKDAAVGDLKEFFHVGCEVPAGHPLEKEYPANIKVGDEVPGFDEALCSLYSRLLGLGQELLSAIAIDLGLSENFFTEYTEYGNSILRPINYPPLKGDEHPDAVRSAAHEDINLITLLIGANYPGLQVKKLDGTWLPVTSKNEQIVVNVGDMLQRLTNYRYISTTHRVANPPKELAGEESSRRYSTPFFLHPVSDMSLKALDSCVSEENPQKDPDTTAGEYLDERLREIGLK